MTVTVRRAWEIWLVQSVHECFSPLHFEKPQALQQLWDMIQCIILCTIPTPKAWLARYRASWSTAGRRIYTTPLLPLAILISQSPISQVFFKRVTTSQNFQIGLGDLIFLFLRINIFSIRFMMCWGQMMSQIHSGPKKQWLVTFEIFFYLNRPKRSRIIVFPQWTSWTDVANFQLI